MSYLWIPIGVGLFAVFFAAYLAISVLRKDAGTPAMQKVADAIFRGVQAFLNRQYRTIAVLAIFAAILVGGVLPGQSGISATCSCRRGRAKCRRHLWNRRRDHGHAHELCLCSGNGYLRPDYG